MFIIFSFLTPSKNVIASSFQQTETQCGYWNVEVSMKEKDARILTTFIHEKSGKDCQGTFRLSNETDVVGSGGYTFELQTNTNNANINWIPREEKSGEKFLLPPLTSEIKVTPIDSSSEASVIIRGDMIIKTLPIDLSLFVLRTGLALIPGGPSCLISEEQLLFAVFRNYDSLSTVSEIALKGNIISSREELEQVLSVFYRRVGDYLATVGVDCASDMFDSITKSEGGILKISYAYLSWVVVALIDYLKYGGQSADVFLIYTPARAPSINRVRVYEYNLGTHVYLSCNEIASMTWNFCCSGSGEWCSPYPDLQYIIYVPDTLETCDSLTQEDFPISWCE